MTTDLNAAWFSPNSFAHWPKPLPITCICKNSDVGYGKRFVEPHACKVSLQEQNISFKIADTVHDILVDYALAYRLHQMLFSSNHVPELVVEERAAKRSDVKVSAAPIAGLSSMLYFVVDDRFLTITMSRAPELAAAKDEP